jgi:amino acid efflux transporter
MTQGSALYVGAVLGPGVLALPALAARAAGPASILSWLGLLVLSVPVAGTFAALGARYPDGGGVATFVSRAFGARAAAPVGWWFYGVVPIGAPAAGWIGGQYVAAALGLHRGGVTVAAVLILAIAFGANYGGLRMSGRLQLAMVGLLVALLLAAVLLAAPHLRAQHLTPFLPHGWSSVGAAGSVLFFAFAGWEAASHLSAEFADPRRHLPRVTALTLLIVAVLYLGLAVTTVGVLGAEGAATPVPLTLLLEHGIGVAARPVTAVAAILLTFGAVNTYLAGAARLGAALARDGALPAWLAKGSIAGQVPRRSLTVLAALTATTVTATAVWSVDLGTLMRATSAFLAAVTAAGMVAGVALLPRGTPRWFAALAGAGFTLVVLVFSGFLLIPPVLVGGAAVLTVGLARRRRRAVRGTDGTPAAPPPAPRSPAPASLTPPR